MFSICFTFTKNYFDAEDLAQETFLSAYKTLKNPDGNVKAYLAAAAANKCRDFLAKCERKNVPLPEAPSLPQTSPPSPVEAEAIDRNTDEYVRKACGRLKEPYKSVAICYFVNGEKLSEMAERTGENIKTLQTRLRRAKAKLKRLYGKEGAF